MASDKILDKQIFKKWWFWVIVVVILGVIGLFTQDTTTTNNTATNTPENNTSNTQAVGKLPVLNKADFVGKEGLVVFHDLKAKGYTVAAKYENEKVISCDFIKETVAKYFSISKDDLAGNKRSNDIAFPRQIAMFLCREIANMSYPQIGVDFGGRDHSTVMHACRKIEKEIKEKTNTKLIVDSVKNIIVNDKKQETK